MSSDENLERTSTAVAVIGDLIKAAGESPEGKRAASNIGKVAVTVTGFVNNLLLPIAAVNYGFEKAHRYFNSNFQSDLEAAAKGIPPADLVEPKASIAAPALQGLAFSHEEPELKQLYLQLLATTMDGRKAASAHPAFVEILRQLTSDEAAFLRFLLTGGRHPIGRIVEVTNDGAGSLVVKRHLLNVVDDKTAVPKIKEDLTSMVDNWVRLGLFDVTYGKSFKGDYLYDWLGTRPEMLRLQAEHTAHDTNLVIERGIMDPTALGMRFGLAIGITSEEMAKPWL